MVDGRVYPSATSPLESNTSSTPVSESTEQRQINSGTTGVITEGSSPNQMQISFLSNQASNNVSLNTFTNQPMNISTHQQLGMQAAQHLPNTQMQQQNYNQHYNPYNMQQHALSQQNQRMPMYQFNNGRIQQPMMAQRPGLGNCHQVYWP